jgi:RNA polymerase sigma-70 factor, ECF subfamily
MRPLPRGVDKAPLESSRIPLKPSVLDRGTQPRLEVSRRPRLLSMRNSSDSQLISDYLSGDEKSFELLIQRHLKPVYNFVYRYAGNSQDAQDITQDAFVKAWCNLHKFNPQRSRSAISLNKKQKSPAPYRTSEASSGSGFKTWIFAIAKNTAFDYLKKKKAIPFSRFENQEGRNMLADRIIDPSHLPQELFERTAISRMLSLAIDKLSPRYRAVVLLHHNDELAFREIAQSLKEPVNTVKSRYRRALILLRKSLES